MFFLDRLDLDRRFRLLRKEIEARGISEDLRGWSFDSPPVQPPSDSKYLGVSEIAGRYCETLRDIYLRRICRIQPPPSVKLARGLIFHNICHRVLFEVKKLLFDRFSGVAGYEVAEYLLPRADDVVSKCINDASFIFNKITSEEQDMLRNEALSLYKFLVIQAAAKIDNTLSKYPHATSDSIVSIAVPPVIERKVDGSLIGLSSELSVDIYTPYNAIADLKTGEIRAFHPLTIAGYALALEAEENIPIDYGLIIYVKVINNVPRFRVRCFVVGDELRREFLDIRDEAYAILEVGRDPGKPSRCPSYCPYYPVCSKERLQ